MQHLIWNINLLVLDSYDSSAKFYISRPGLGWTTLTAPRKHLHSSSWSSDSLCTAAWADPSCMRADSTCVKTEKQDNTYINV